LSVASRSAITLASSRVPGRPLGGGDQFGDLDPAPRRQHPDRVRICLPLRLRELAAEVHQRAQLDRVRGGQPVDAPGSHGRPPQQLDPTGQHGLVLGLELGYPDVPRGGELRRR
jgi:hypothetical protein